MRHRPKSSEFSQLIAPLLGFLDKGWSRMHWWVALMAILYSVSGITVIRSDEVAVVKHWGRLVGDSPATQQHGPGLLFAFPRPIDQVVRVKTRYIQELAVRVLAQPLDIKIASNTLDPLREGYALTGDQNIVQLGMVARYRVRDPVDWVFYGPDTETILRTETSAAMVRSLGEVAIDRVLAEERKDLIKNVSKRVQTGLDAVHSGLELVSLELTDLAPPKSLVSSFEEVQSAYIEAETKKKEAQAYAQNIIPGARAYANQLIQTAKGDSAASLARSAGDVEAFRALEVEYKKNPSLIRERLYRDTVEKVLGRVESVQWIPPPVDGHYRGTRVLVPSSDTGLAPAANTINSTASAGYPPEDEEEE